MLASDLNNPEFAGAINPDSRLAVQFYKRPIENEFRSQLENRPIFEEMDFVKIYVPGDSTTVIDTAVREEHKKRFPLQWAHYQNTHGSDTKEIGTPLAQWPQLNKAQVEELRALKFFTVESVAGASDQNIVKIGMLAGMSPHAFREKAQRFLRVAHDDAATQAAEERAKFLEEENKKLREETEKKLAELQAQIASLSKRRGRKPKVAAE